MNYIQKNIVLPNKNSKMLQELNILTTSDSRMKEYISTQMRIVIQNNSEAIVIYKNDPPKSDKQSTSDLFYSVADFSVQKTKESDDQIKINFIYNQVFSPVVGTAAKIDEFLIEEAIKREIISPKKDNNNLIFYNKGISPERKKHIERQFSGNTRTQGECLVTLMDMQIYDGIIRTENMPSKKELYEPLEKYDFSIQEIDNVHEKVMQRGTFLKRLKSIYDKGIRLENRINS